MASFLDCCRFTPTAGGTTDWTVSSAVTGYQTPASANAVNGAIYRYRAESFDLSQWEVGYGAYTVSGTVLARTTVLFNSSGGTSKINFSAAPQVAVVALAEDLSPSQIVQSAPGVSLSPTGTANTSGVMMGMGGTIKITPANSTRVRISVRGVVTSSLINTIPRWKLYFGTGTAPSNAASVTGTQVGTSQSLVSGVAGQAWPFTIDGVVTGLTVGTAYWFDLSLAQTTGGGTATGSEIGYTIEEV